MQSQTLDADVIVAGGGPCGLVTALELGRRNVRTMLFNDFPDTSPLPRANASQARTMEHYRRLGLSKRIREAGLPPDYPTDVAYFTRLTQHELARLELPASGQANNLVKSMSGSWSAAELPHRCSQMYVERILREEAAQLSSVSLRFGWKIIDFVELDDCIEVEVLSDNGDQFRFSSSYLVGADGSRGITRKRLGIRYEGERTLDRPFFAGQMYNIYFRSNQIYDLIPHRRAWQYWTVNPQRRALMVSLDGKSAFVCMSQLQKDEDPAEFSLEFLKGLVYQCMGREFDVQINAHSPWTAGLTLVAERFQSGRTFLAGDAVHLFTPTGGLGYNTAVEDGVNLGWKLAAVVRGWAPETLMSTYELERKPVAQRNTTFARNLADSLGGFKVPVDIEECSEVGVSSRNAMGEYLNRHARAEFNIPGITFGARYDGSPIIIPDGTVPPPDEPNVYRPTACPGGRAPHAWLSDGRSLYDAFGFEFTFLCLTNDSRSLQRMIDAAATRKLPLAVLDLSKEGLQELYEAKFAMIRPDQIVCWRGDQLPSDAGRFLGSIVGAQ